MSKKVIYDCDLCGRELKESPAADNFVVLLSIGTYLINKSKIEPVSEKELYLCNDCYKKFDNHIENFTKDS